MTKCDLCHKEKSNVTKIAGSINICGECLAIMNKNFMKIFKNKMKEKNGLHPIK